MTQVTFLKDRPNTTRRLNKNSKLFKAIIQAIQGKKGDRIVSLDLRKVPEAVADFFVICEAASGVQVRAIAEEIDERVKKETGEIPYMQEGKAALQWVLIDYVNIVVHIFQPETRRFYRLEEMWSDGVRQEHDI